MRYVLDANVALRALLREEHSDKAQSLMDDFRNGVHELIAPDFFPLEVANALTRAERRRGIKQGQAIVLLADILLQGPELRDSSSLLVRATELSSLLRASVFDCMYLVLAEDEHCEFVTADRKILNAFPTHPRIVELSTL